MPLNKMRVGDVVAVEGRVLDADGNETEFLQNEDWDSADAGVATVTPDGVNPRLAEVEAVAPGTVAITFSGDNQFSDPVSAQAEAVVLDADRLVLRTGAGNFVKVLHRNGVIVLMPGHELSPGGLRIEATIVPVDERDLADSPPVYASGLTNIGWITDHQRVLFDTGTGADPTASGALTLDLVPNEAGEDVIHVSALNSVGQPIAGHFDVLVLATLGARIVEAGVPVFAAPRD